MSEKQYQAYIKRSKLKMELEEVLLSEAVVCAQRNGLLNEKDLDEIIRYESRSDLGYIYRNNLYRIFSIKKDRMNTAELVQKLFYPVSRLGYSDHLRRLPIAAIVRFAEYRTKEELLVVLDHLMGEVGLTHFQDKESCARFLNKAMDAEDISFFVMNHSSLLRTHRFSSGCPVS